MNSKRMNCKIYIYMLSFFSCLWHHYDATFGVLKQLKQYVYISENIIWVIIMFFDISVFKFRIFLKQNGHLINIIYIMHKFPSKL